MQPGTGISLGINLILSYLILNKAPKGDDGAEEVDWLHAVKRRREALLEDCGAKSDRLKGEGAILAEEGR